MGSVTKLRQTTIDQLIEQIHECGVTDCVLVGTNADGEIITMDTGMDIAALSLATTLMQAKVMQDAGRLLGPDDIE